MSQLFKLWKRLKKSRLRGKLRSGNKGLFYGLIFRIAAQKEKQLSNLERELEKNITLISEKGIKDRLK